MAPIKPVVEAPPVAPQMFARVAREPGAPHIVAISFLFWQSGATTPAFVLENGAMQFWEMEGTLALRRAAARRFSRPTPTTCAAFTSSGALVATGQESGQVQLHRLEHSSPRGECKGRLVETFAAHRGRVLSLAWSESRLWSAGSDGTVVSVGVPPTGARFRLSHREQVVLDGLSWLCGLSVSPDGGWLALGGEDGEVQMWRTSQEGAAQGREWATHQHRSRVERLAFSPHGKMLVSQDAEGTTRLWAAHTGHQLQLIEPGISGGPAPALAPDNRLLALAGAEEVHLLDAWTGMTRWTLPLLVRGAQALAFSPLPNPAAQEILLLVAGAQEIVAWKVAL